VQFAGDGQSERTNAVLSWDDVTCRRSTSTRKKGIRWVRLSHAHRAIDARFDDPNLVSCAGLVPVMALAQRCGLDALLADRVTVAANAAVKVLALVAGMVAGADSITDLDLLRHGGMGRLFTEVISTRSA
jgi:hypothetical protein